MEEMFEWFSYLHASADDKCESTHVAAGRYRINLHHRFPHALSSPPEGEESCIMLESRLNRWLVAKLLQHSSLAVHEFCTASKECYKLGYGRVCVKLWCRMERIRTIAAMYMSSVDLLLGGYTEDLKKPHNCQKWDVGCLPGTSTRTLVTLIYIKVCHTVCNYSLCLFFPLSANSLAHCS